MPPIVTPKLPGWADPQMASVTDPWYTSLARKAASLIGADDPASQAMGLGGAMEVPQGALSKQLMIRAERAAAAKRAAQQGYTHDVFHATKSDFSEFDPSKMDFGIHVTPRPETASAAVQATDKYGNVDGPWVGGLPDEYMKGAKTLPLKARMAKTLHMPDMGAWRDPEHWVGQLRRSGTFDKNIPTNDPKVLEELYNAANEVVSKSQARNPKYPWAQAEAQWPHEATGILRQHGYDSIAYPNSAEGIGELSYMLLHPQQVRSRFARFLPENMTKGDLLGSLVGGTALAGTASPGGSNGQ